MHLGRIEQEGVGELVQGQKHSLGEADLAVRRRGEAWGREAINPSPAVYPCWYRRRGDWALAQSMCW